MTFADAVELPGMPHGSHTILNPKNKNSINMCKMCVCVRVCMCVYISTVPVLGTTLGVLICCIGTLMTLTCCLYYTGFLCKLQATLPRALIVSIKSVLYNIYFSKHKNKTKLILYCIWNQSCSQLSSILSPKSCQEEKQVFPK